MIGPMTRSHVCVTVSGHLDPNSHLHPAPETPLLKDFGGYWRILEGDGRCWRVLEGKREYWKVLEGSGR